MSVAPSPSSSRGEVILQPAYFTSSAFVCVICADIDHLFQQYSKQYAHSRSRPFALFKGVWQAQGWPWIQFKVFDARSRATFLRVTIRLFSERIGSQETPLDRAAALFSLYTMIHTQPSSSAPPLYSAARVEVTCDLYEEIMTLPDALDSDFLLPVRPHVVYVQSELLQAQTFQVLPRVETHPLNPRALPREVVVKDEDTTTSTAQGRKKKGRPSKRDKIRQVRDSLVVLDGWCENTSGSQLSRTRRRYADAKSALADTIGGDPGWERVLREANAAVAERIEAVGGLVD